jgi:glycine cleavage system H protein
MVRSVFGLAALAAVFATLAPQAALAQESQCPAYGYRYTADMFWVRVNGDVATIGVAPVAFSEVDPGYLGFTQDIGAQITAGQVIGSLEGVLGILQLTSPVSGTLSAINHTIEADPEALPIDPFQEGWLYKIDVGENIEAEIDTLMTADEFGALGEGYCG